MPDRTRCFIAGLSGGRRIVGGGYTAARMKNIVILLSGRGSNMEAIVRACADEGWDARIAAVVSNRPDAAGLQFAAQRGISTAVVDHKAFARREDFDAELANCIEGFAPDALALAGFMRILSPAFVGRFDGRMVNVHPSLLPAFTGLHTHRRAIEAGCKLAGATVHFEIGRASCRERGEVAVGGGCVRV